MDGVELDFREEMTFLGHVIQNSMKDDDDIRKQLQEFNTAGKVSLILQAMF